MDIFGAEPDPEKMPPTDAARHWFAQPAQASLREYVEDLASSAGSLGPWIRQIYPALYYQYVRHEDPGVETDDVQRFSFVLFQYLHQ
ncbi:MAG: hypothetical protein IJI97_01515 [Clostridia bacterium]|nr:hypothetical protein [Clostridia bacterium]